MFSERLKKLREETGYRSQQEMADALGVAQSTVANWECGRREPNYETTLRLADFFGTTADYLLGRSDAPGGVEPHQMLKAALWGGEVDLSAQELDELWDDVREYAAYKMEQRKRRKE